MSRSLLLYKIGSDPEFVFARVKEWSPYIIPASTVISPNKAQALNSFIGTDNHAATAELRPPPAHNIRRHMLDIAYGLAETENFLSRTKNMRDVVLLAHPWVQGVTSGEPLGGHIHTTFWVYDPDLARVASKANRYYHDTLLGWKQYNMTKPVPDNVDDETVNAMERYGAEAANYRRFSAMKYILTMNYLLYPLEMWCQLWPLRITRNMKYGPNNGDPVRLMASDHPVNPKGGVYFHIEYRIPSTWLTHPWLAYAYFALAKITLVNWDIISASAVKNRPGSEKQQPQGVPANDSYRQQLIDRLASLRPRILITRDCQDIDKALQVIERNRENWFRPCTSIQTVAWRTLLV